MIKRRAIYFILYLIVVPIGYATRKLPQLFHPFIAEFGGDTLWAAMFVFLFRAIWSKTALWKLVLYTYLFTVAIEISQLYHAPWIDRLRSSFLGKMLLGSGFLWSDLACYLTGVVFAWLVATFVDKYSSE